MATGQNNERLIPTRASDVEKGAKTDSYIVAMSGGGRQHEYRPAPTSPPPNEPVIYEKSNDAVYVPPTTRPPPTTTDSIGLTKEELEQYRNDPFWKRLRYVTF